MKIGRTFLGVVGVVALFPAGAMPQAAPDQAAPADHVVLVSIDGLRPEFYLDESWPAPELQRMAREGSHARGVVSVFPSNTYPAHATVVTGVPPATHGIVHNQPFEPEGVAGRWYWEDDSVRVRTLWDAVEEAGGTSAAFSWPVTVQGPIRWNVPEVWPPGSYDDRLEAIREHTRPAGFLAELERQATGHLVAWDSTGATTRWEQGWWDERNADMAEYVVGRYRPTLTAIHLVVADGIQHEVGRESPRLRGAVALVDRALSRLVEAARRTGIEERTAFVVVGDHGIIEFDTVLAPNVWLAAAGLRSDESGLGEGWRATFHGGGGSTFLRLRHPDDVEALARVRELVEELPEETRRRFRVLERAQLDALGADPEASLALAAETGSYFTQDPRPPAVRERSGGGHGYLPDLHPEIHTGLVAWGAGVREGGRISRASLTDVAPLVAALLRVELGELDTRVEEAFLRPP